MAMTFASLGFGALHVDEKRVGGVGRGLGSYDPEIIRVSLRQVMVLAVFHTSRHPSVWQSRA